MNPLDEPNVFIKLEKIKSYRLRDSFDLKEAPARNIRVLRPKKHPVKKGIASRDGQIRLLHDLASIELQAAELCLRTLIEFRDRAPKDFLDELLVITKEEALHCRLCLDALEKLGGYWGMYPCHLELWFSAHKNDSLLDRILKVHRYLEGSGLDASTALLNKLKSFKNSEVLRKVVHKIVTDELDHVKFGSNWFKKICREENKVPFKECRRILLQYKNNIPRRREKINSSLREQAGFSPDEIKVFKEFQKSI